MVIGVPKEIKTHEYRVSLTPQGASELRKSGHRVLVEKSAGDGSGFPDGEYVEAGAEITDKERLFSLAGLIVKVKEPIPPEFGLLRRGQAIFTYLHLAANRELTSALLSNRITALGYETLEEDGTLPLLTPMSEIAGRMSPLVAAYHLQRPLGGSGVLSCGAPGVPPASIAIIGAGTVGASAARIAYALGMRVTVLNRGTDKLRKLDDAYQGRINTLVASAGNIEEQVTGSDISVGAVLVAGAKAPVLVSRKVVSSMKKGSVIVDVSVDQGGCFETTRPTTHDKPTYEVDGVIHYAVSNMPGAYPRTSTIALTNSTLPYIKKLASLGGWQDIADDRTLGSALNTHDGKIVHSGVAKSLGLPEEGGG